MEKIFTPNNSSNYYRSPKDLGSPFCSHQHHNQEIDVMKPDPFVIRNILNYARALEVLKPQNKLVFFFVKN